ncbi:AAA family ATPase [Micromonospora rifamycinica]|uniref:AAA family ATPase n=1 Tax=Micromonospora rifamycinica TaxID=291594 RepID=UPI0038B3369D
MSRWGFVGRTDELTRLRAAVREGRGRGLFVSGSAGIGKSRLLREGVAALPPTGTRCRSSRPAPPPRRCPSAGSPRCCRPSSRPASPPPACCAGGSTCCGNRPPGGASCSPSTTPTCSTPRRRPWSTCSPARRTPQCWGRCAAASRSRCPSGHCGPTTWSNTPNWPRSGRPTPPTCSPPS